MALTVENGHEAPLACPVCFENVLPAKRTLACRHVFCQDCLSKIMVVAQNQGSIVCPLCRKETILYEKKQADETLAENVCPTPELALPLPMGHFVASRASTIGHGDNWLMQYLRRLYRRTRTIEQTIAYRNGSQVFIIRDQVRPTTRSVTAVSRWGCRIAKCCCIFLALVIFLIVLFFILMVSSKV